MLYELHNVVRQFGERTVLEIDHLGFEARKIYALIGPNGAGKTTLLNQLSFLDRPNSGHITFKNETVSYEQSVLTRLRRQVVLVDQTPILFTGSVWKNIEFGLKVRNIPRHERTLRIQQALERVTMADFAHLDAHGLSGGEVKRVALARALALEPEVLLCDEPTANVDREHQEIILKILSHANSVKNTTIIFSTHYLSQSRRLADHTILLQNGRLSKHLEENTFHIRLVKRGDLLKGYLADRHLLPLANISSKWRENQRVRVHIDPRQVRLLPSPDGGDDGNIIHGEIVSISGERGNIRVGIDIGVNLQVLMDEQQFLMQPYQVLQNVSILIPQQAVQLMP